MLELMKELGFIPESRAVKLYNLMCQDGPKVVGERYDRVTYLRQVLSGFSLSSENPIYVEAGRFFPLLPFIRTAIATPDYLKITLRNGAEYKLEYLEIEFSRPRFSVEEPTFQMGGKMDLSILKKTALQNLVKPEMRCIYVDQRGAVSCNFLQGTVDKTLRSQAPLLLPPDLINYMTEPTDDGTVLSFGDYLLYTDRQNIWVWAPTSELSQEEDPWYETIYNSAISVDDSLFYDKPEEMDEALKRLSLFGSEGQFCSDSVRVGENYEPMLLPSATDGVYTLDEVSSVIQYGKKIAFTDSSMLLRNGDVTILISEKEDE